MFVLRSWFDDLSEKGPQYGYDVNPIKTWLIVKEEHLFKAERLFQDTGVNITVEGRRHLGGAIGKEDFVRVYVEEQVQK